MTLIDSVRLRGDSFFNGVGARKILLRFGEKTIVSPTPLITYDGITQVTDVPSALSESDAYEGYTVSIGIATIQRVWKSVDRFVIAATPNVVWYCKHTDDNQGWRKCRQVGLPQMTAVDYKVKLARLGVNDV